MMAGTVPQQTTQARSPLLPTSQISASQFTQFLLHGLPVGVSVYDADGQLVDCNETVRRWRGSDLEYNVLKDPQLEQLGLVNVIMQAWAGESVDVPPYWYDFSMANLSASDPKRLCLRERYWPLMHQGECARVFAYHEEVTDKVLAECQAAELSRIPEADPHIVLQVDAEGSVLFYNSSAIRLLQQVGLDRYELNPLLPSSIREHATYLMLHPKETRQIEHTLGGHTILYTARAFPRDDRVYLSGVDITDRKRIEQSLIHSERQYRTLFESSSDALMLINTRRRYVDVNQEACRLYGYDRHELIGIRAAELLSADGFNAKTTDSLFKRVLGGDDLEFEWRGRRKDGTVFPEEVKLKAIQIQNQPHVLAIVRDVTRRKQIQKQLAESEQRYRTLFENSPVGLYRTTPEGRILNANPTLIRMLGYESFEDLQKRDIDKEGYGAGFSRSQFLQQIEAKGTLTGWDTTWRKKDGSMIHVRENATAIRDPNGRVLYFEGTVEDISDRVQYSQQLQYRLEFEKKIANISTHFINLAPEEIDQGILDALGSIGQFADVDRSYIFQFSPDAEVIDNTHEWCAPGIAPQQHRLRNIPSTELPWVIAQHLEGKIVHIPRVRDLPDEASAERREFTKENIQSLICVPLMDAGKPVGFVGFDSVRCEKSWSEDIISLLTIVGEIFVNALSRQKTTRALQATEEKFRSIFEHAVHGIYQSSIDGTYLTVNPKMAEILGFSSSEELMSAGTDLSKQFYVHPNRREQFMKLIMRRGAISGFESEVYRKDGSTIWISENARIVRNDQGEAIGFEGSMVDITQRKRAQWALREQKKFLRQIIDLNPNFIFAKDREGRYTLVNQAVADTYGTTVEALIGKCDEDFNPQPDEVRQFREDDLKVMNTGKELLIPEEKITHSRTGEVRYLQTVKRPILDEDGYAHQVLGVSTDITERKHAEQEQQRLQTQLFQSQKMESVGLLAGGIAHDFNNLLSGIMGFASLSLNELSAGNPATNFIVLIQQSAEKAARLTRELLAYAQGGPRIREVLDLNHLLNDMLNLLTANVPKNAQVNRKLCSSVLSVYADPAQIQQVIMNLFINAGEAISGDPGVIGIRTTECTIGESHKLTRAPHHLRPGKYARLDVSDTGVGLQPEVQSKIFEPFFSTKRFGRGMGLAAVQGIVKNHQGCIRVSSKPGNGTTFTIYLPMTDALPDKTGQALPQLCAGNETILIADDEEVIRQVVERGLGKLGYHVLSASSGQDALKTFQDHMNEIELVILDMMLPDMNGDQVIVQMNDLARHPVSVLISSGYSETMIREKFQHAPIAGFIQKPYTIQTLGQVVREALDSRLSPK